MSGVSEHDLVPEHQSYAYVQDRIAYICRLAVFMARCRTILCPRQHLCHRQSEFPGTSRGSAGLMQKLSMDVDWSGLPPLLLLLGLLHLGATTAVQLGRATFYGGVDSEYTLNDGSCACHKRGGFLNPCSSQFCFDYIGKFTIF